MPTLVWLRPCRKAGVHAPVGVEAGHFVLRALHIVARQVVALVALQVLLRAEGMLPALMKSARLILRPPLSMPRQFFTASEMKAWVGTVVKVLSQLCTLMVVRAISSTSPSAPYFVQLHPVAHVHHVVHAQLHAGHEAQDGIL